MSSRAHASGGRANASGGRARGGGRAHARGGDFGGGEAVLDLPVTASCRADEAETGSLAGRELYAPGVDVAAIVGAAARLGASAGPSAPRAELSGPRRAPLDEAGAGRRAGSRGAGSGDGGDGGGGGAGSASAALAASAAEHFVLRRAAENPEAPELAALFARGVDPGRIREILAARFKPEGPQKTGEWLSDLEIDMTLRRLAALTAPDFYPYPFAYVDFAEKRSSPLGTVPLDAALSGSAPADLRPYAPPRAAPCTTAGAVLNSDRTGGKGIHWVAVFADTRGDPWTLEFFNSTGRAVYPPVLAWMEGEGLAALRRLAAERGFGGEVRVCAEAAPEHQVEDGECGVYALLYIVARVAGNPRSEFWKADVYRDDLVALLRPLFFTRGT